MQLSFNMNTDPSKQENLAVRAPETPASANAQEATFDASMEAVRESAHQRASQTLPTQSQDDSHSDASGYEEKDPIVRENLRERLLKTAPAPKQMSSEVKSVLTKEKKRLESQIRMLSKKRSFHVLSKAIAELRAIVHQIESLAQVSLQRLQELWLKWVHQLSF